MQSQLQRPLLHSAAYCPQSCINLARWGAQNERYYRIPSDFDVLERTHDVYLSTEQH